MDILLLNKIYGLFMKKIIVILITLFAFYQYIFYIPTQTMSDDYYTTSTETISNDNKENKIKSQQLNNNTIENAFKNRSSNIQVNSSGTVIRILKDDIKGSRHQKFILRLNSGQTLLVAHNIDLAPRINSISNGDIVEFYGEYEWNSKGGLIHWTHHDPKNHHVGGWLKHNRRTYQ